LGRSWITVGFSPHRVECLAAAEAAIAGHAVVVLEEPPTASFAAMLAGRATVDDHLEDLIPEFPIYSRHQSFMLRRMHDRGVRIVQMEPYMAELEAIHDLFESGGRPADLQSSPTRWQVYQAEKQATGALIDYYAASAGPDFDRVVDAVCDFARADAERGRLRDAMRAEGVVEAFADEGGGVYVEAGSVHAGLVGQLRRRLTADTPVRPRWLSAAAVRRLGGASLPFAPGDLLTFAFAGRRARDRARTRLLAARSLVHVAISVKDEMLPTPEDSEPHAREELETWRLVGHLAVDDCRRLYAAIRSRPQPESRATVRRYLAERQ
jgi:hypothetical protein